MWKLNSKALFDRQRLRELQASYGEAVAPLGIRRGEPGSIATHSEVRQFYGAVNATKGIPERVKLPPAPKPPAQPSGFMVEASNALGAAFGIETEHQRAMKAHATAMQQWRETCRELRQQDAKAWERMKAVSAISPLVRKQIRPHLLPGDAPAPALTTAGPSRPAFRSN